MWQAGGWPLSRHQAGSLLGPALPLTKGSRAQTPEHPYSIFQSAVPSPTAASPDLRDEVCTFLLYVPRLLSQSEVTQEGAGAGSNPPTRGDIYPDQASQWLLSLPRRSKRSKLKLLQ